MDKGTIGKNIRAKRKELGLTLEQFADKVDLTRNYLAEIERGIKLPSINSFIKIVNGLNISADEILKDEVQAAKPIVHNMLYDLTKDLSPKELKMVLDVVSILVKNINDKIIDFQ